MLINLLLLQSSLLLEAFLLTLDRTAPLSPFLDETLSLSLCSWCYDWYFFFNRLSTFSLVHLILSWHMIILSQGMLSFIYFLMRSMISLMLSQPSFNLHAVHSYAFFSSLPFDTSCITHVYASIICTAYLISTTHSPGPRVYLMHTVLVDPIQSCTNSMSSI